MLASTTSALTGGGVFNLLVTAYLAILVHELGHAAIAVRARGTDPVVIGIGSGPRVLGFQRGRAQFVIGLLPWRGSVRWDPPRMTAGMYRRFISAGPWMSIAGAVVFGLFAVFAQKAGSGTAFAWLVGFAVQNLLVGAGNAIPFKRNFGLGVVTSDGYRLRELNRDGLVDHAVMWDRTTQDVAAQPVPSSPSVAAVAPIAPMAVPDPARLTGPPVLSPSLDRTASIAPPGMR